MSRFKHRGLHRPSAMNFEFSLSFNFYNFPLCSIVRKPTSIPGPFEGEKERPWCRPVNPDYDWLANFDNLCKFEINLSKFEFILHIHDGKKSHRLKLQLETQFVDSVVVVKTRNIWVRIFSKAGTSKNLCVKIKKLCGVEVCEDDGNSKVLCRQCVAFMNKMEDFIVKAQSLQEKPPSELSVKRCMLQSPTQQPSKRIHQINQSQLSSAKQLGVVDK